MTENEIGKIVVDAAVKVHKALGPGLLETNRLRNCPWSRTDEEMAPY
jgi:hypothetical protein